ncbi:alpha/beta fold hydrolase [Methylobacterium nonmethylotrophicum]|uniref:Alpha/beta fold hydrolase n=1 Tax=Methylobacterium nonmethylotrophicum TaxID=1141884 RepID=A0A4Z0NV59_9HYPH|nr:alpha/beta fold hydrolase [Methylobacterium nonmethylotrophicum]TGE00814.1 alpha/beta fold hydrolase [Methylobacterium nonmethylotrophicum]
MLTDGIHDAPLAGAGPLASLPHAAGTRPAAAEPVPVALGDAFGWFTAGSRRRGVLLCGTFGFEQGCAYRSWRELAALMAASGCPTLRFDYPGQGDSRDPQEGEIPAALTAIRAGIAFLRERAGAEEIVVVGLRLGGTLAALAAEGVDRLVLLAPFATGKAYRREMAMQARLLDVMPDRTPMPQEPDALMVGSFLLGPRTLADLGRLDLMASMRAPAPRILMLGPKVEALAERYRALGSAVETGPFPDLTQLVSDPLFSRTPDQTFALVRDFAVAEAPPATSVAAPALPACRLEDAEWREEVTRFGPGLVGILCRPAAEWSGDTVLVVNSGRNPRAGHGRQTTRLARRLAGAGIASFRFDLRGIGDSAERPDGSLPLYAADSVADVTAAIDHLDALRHTPGVVLGNCSGAYQAFQALSRDSRLRAAVLLNLYCFDLKPGTDVETMVRDTFRHSQGYMARARQGRFWRRILSGEIGLDRIARALLRDAAARLDRWTARMPWRTLGGGVVDRVAALRRRGARICMVYSADDLGIPTVAAHFGGSEARIARRLGYPVQILHGTDHNLSRPADQDRVFAILERVVRETGRDNRPGAAPEPAAPRPAPHPGGLTLRLSRSG